MNRSKPDTVNNKEQFWVPHIKKWQSSEISQTQYCIKNNLTLRMFSYWKKKICKKPAKSIELVQVKTTSFNIPTNSAIDTVIVPLKLKINNIFEIEISEGFSQKTLHQIIGVLGEYQ